MSEDHYVGGELELFAEAHNWKRYLRSQLRSYLTGDVLEVGAGLGGTTRVLFPGDSTSWTCLEPDEQLASRIEQAVAAGELAESCRVRIGTLEDLDPERRFDAILYVDVLEHIEDDHGELSAAVGRLRPGGVVAVLSPAHEWLFTAFDESIGHFRRYDRGSLRELTPEGARLERFRYLDSVGVSASAANRLFLRSGMPTAGQIRVWDRLMVPISRMLDPLLGYRFGKSVLGVWRKQTSTMDEQDHITAGD